MGRGTRRLVGAQGTRGTRTAALAAACGLVACSPPPPSSVSLARAEIQREPLSAPQAWEEAPTGSLTLLDDPTESGVWIEATLPDAAWTPYPDLPGVWHARRPFAGWGEPVGGEPRARLETASATFRLVDHKNVWRALHKSAGTVPAPPESFCLYEEHLVATTAGTEPPRSARVHEYLRLDWPGSGGTRTRIGRYAADGFALRTGSRLRLRTMLEPGCSLHFHTVAFDRLFDDSERRLRFRVSVDGQLAFLADQVVSQNPLAKSRVVPLEIDDRRRATIELSVEGAPSLGAFLAPRIVRNSVQARGRRPDVVLLVADGFPLAELQDVGNDASVTPVLASLAEHGAVFTRAWAPAPWTLPSIASFFTGLHPHQHGAVRRDASLPEGAVTLAELFRDAGYETRGIAAGDFLAPAYGLDAGFELFDSGSRDVDGTLLRLQPLLGDRGERPLFLLVHARGDAADLDRLSAGVLDLLGKPPSRGRILVFTAAHGQTGPLRRTGEVRTDELRVPLVLHGAGFKARIETSNASLLDLGRTLLSQARIEVPRNWNGRDLSSTNRARVPILAFGCAPEGAPSQACIIVDDFKAVLDLGADPDGLDAELFERTLRIHDMQRDPDEHEDLSSPRGELWDLFTAQRGWLDLALTPHLGPRPAETIPDELGDPLGGLPYLDD